jgi:hydroxymethylpyrimidine/phosphomethylpyrimidine kinase
MKGGHGAGDESADFLVTPQLVRRYGVQRIATNNTHGTGCTLSAAMAAGLAKGETLESAVASAKAICTGALGAADHLRIGRGHGPVHHFHAVWPT